MIDLLRFCYFYVCTVHLLYSFYFNQQCTLYIVYFNNNYIIITPEDDTNVSKHVGMIII